MSKIKVTEKNGYIIVTNGKATFKMRFSAWERFNREQKTEKTKEKEETTK